MYSEHGIERAEGWLERELATVAIDVSLLTLRGMWDCFRAYYDCVNNLS